MRLVAAAVSCLAIATSASAVEVTIPNEFTGGTTAVASEVNANFDAVEAAIEQDEHFYAVAYASGSDSGGIVEAYNACVTAGGGTVVLPFELTSIDGSDFTGDMLLIDDSAACNITGYGSDGTDGDALEGGSVISVSNSAGLDIFDVQTSGVTLSNFTLLLAGANSTTRGIVCGETSNVKVEDVLMDSDGTTGTGAGVGIDMYRCLKATVNDSETQQFAIGLRMDSYSNATSIISSRFRAGGLGIHLAGTDGAVADNIMIDSVTVEGNERGMLFDGNSTFAVSMVAPHFEQDAGTLGSRYNITISNAGARVNVVGGSFGGTLNANKDIVRTVGSSTFGPDVFVGGRFAHGLDYSASNAKALMVGPKIVADSVGGVYSGFDLYHATDCETAIVNYTGAVFGTTCAEPDGDIWQCRDVDHASGTLDGICDHADEVEKIAGTNSIALGTDTTGNYAGSSSEGGAATTATALAANGANCSAGNFPLGVDASGAAESCTDVVLPSEVAAYTTGTSTPVDGSTACNTGDMHLETDAFKIYFCVDGSTDKWYGVALSDTP